MQKICFLLILLSNIVGYCQIIAIKDSESQQHIPYASIYLIEKDIQIAGFSADENGTINVPSQNFDRLKLSCIGYEDRLVDKNEIKGIIYLSPRKIELEEISISNSIEKLGYFTGKKGRYLGLLKDTETVVYIPNTFNKPISIKAFSMKIKKAKVTNVARLLFYAVSDTLHRAPGETLLGKDIIFNIEQGHEGLVEVDLSGYDIILPAEGAYVGLNIIECYDANGLYSRDIHHMNEFETVTSGQHFHLINRKYPSDKWINSNQLWEATGKKYSRRRDRKYFVLGAFWITVSPG
ncbi:MAG: hypothetical protein EOO45_20555 [Flavobacterium sp.]|nr:MAG: hypothetical protein EOO45_20555 [Flavobacterium sp.]